MKNWIVHHHIETSIRHDCQVRTNEDWHPTINGELKMSVMKYKTDEKNKLNRICIWGGDDFGMDRDFMDFESVTFDDMKKIANEIPEPITVNWLLANGFTYA